MPRKSRIDAPGAIHHIIVRGIEGSSIFRDSKDYENFIARLGNLVQETSTCCYAWVLTGNHLLIRSGLFPVSSLMRRLLTGYAQQVNQRRNRSGHLFQNRCKSFLCEEWQDDAFVLRLFHEKQGPARRAYTSFVEKGIAFDTPRLRGIDIAKRLALSPAAVSKLAQRGRRDPLSEEIERTLFGKGEE